MDILLSLIEIAIISIFTLFLSIFIHEFGHFIAAKISGYKFLSFSFLGLTVYKYKNQFKFKYKNIKGIGGQCLMQPPPFNDKWPYKFYNFGGVIANSLTAVISAAVILKSNPSILFHMFLFCLVVYNLLFAFINGIPIQSSGIPTDGMNILYASKDKHSRKSFYHMFQFEKELEMYEGFKNMPYEIVKVSEDADLSNFINGYMKLNEGSFFIENGKSEDGLNIFMKLILYTDNYPGYYKAIIKNEIIFYFLINKVAYDLVDKYWTEDHIKYCKKMSIINYYLAQSSYELIINKDIEESKKCIEKYEEKINSILHSYQKDLAYKQIDLIENAISNSNNF